MKSFLRKIKYWLIFQRESYLDGKRFLKSTPWAGPNSGHSLAHLESDIVRRYHVIEKGLSMPDFRPRFGEIMVKQLVNLLTEWDSRIDRANGDEAQIMAARATIASYRAKHVSLGIDVSDLLGCCPADLELVDCSMGGTQLFSPVAAGATAGFESVVRTRASIRNFDLTKEIDDGLIEKAVEISTRAPSVCNRQTWRVHQYHGEHAQEVLSLQTGNRGFGHTIPCVLVVTSDLRYFTSTVERYQPWIDGGMFSMLLLLALHSLGLGAVALNWSVMNKRDEQLRQIAGLPEYERVIMIIGCGHPIGGSLLPKSQRRSAKSILKRHT